MKEVGECPRCNLMAGDWEREVRAMRLQGPDVFDQVNELDGTDEYLRPMPALSS
jgi:hypothetical protein